jgi:polysaccharide pyruvyl transferase CsaB
MPVGFAAMEVLVAAWVGSANLGDELVFAGLRRKLAARGVSVTAVSVDPDATGRCHGVEAIGDRDVPRLWAAAGRAGAVVFGGGGLLQDETSPVNLPYHLSRVWAARLRGTPFVGVGLGAGRLDTRLGRALVRRTMRAARGLSVRDAASAELLERLGAGPVTVAADLALALPPPAAAAEDRVVVCLRPWTGAPGRVPPGLRRRADAVPPAFVDAAAAALDRIAATGLGVRFVAFQADRDDAVHARVAGAMQAPSTRAVPGLDEVLDEIAAARAVVAVRYHGGVAAALAGRPAVLIGYSPKVGALAADLGAGASLLPWDAAALAGLPDAVEAVAGQDAAVRAARARLRAREAGNDAVLDRVLPRVRVQP